MSQWEDQLEAECPQRRVQRLLACLPACLLASALGEGGGWRGAGKQEEVNRNFMVHNIFLNIYLWYVGISVWLWSMIAAIPLLVIYV